MNRLFVRQFYNEEECWIVSVDWPWKLAKRTMKILESEVFLGDKASGLRETRTHRFRIFVKVFKGFSFPIYNPNCHHYKEQRN